jgi:hypothetical protein
LKALFDLGYTNIKIVFTSVDLMQKYLHVHVEILETLIESGICVIQQVMANFSLGIACHILIPDPQCLPVSRGNSGKRVEHIFSKIFLHSSAFKCGSQCCFDPFYSIFE